MDQTIIPITTRSWISQSLFVEMRRFFFIVGHEICGEIAEVGKNVQGFSVGEHVSIANVIPCGHCPACLSGRENACMNRKAIGYEFNGGFEEYVLIPKICIESGNVVKLPEGSID